MAERSEKVNEVVKEELSKIILKNLDFERGAMVTITRVETSSDLRYAKIMLTVFPESEEKTVLDLLEKNAGDLQYELIKKLRTKPIPKIRFESDKAQKLAERMEELLAKKEE